MENTFVLRDTDSGRYLQFKGDYALKTDNFDDATIFNKETAEAKILQHPYAEKLDFAKEKNSKKSAKSKKFSDDGKESDPEKTV